MPGEREVTVAGRGPTRQELIRRQRRSGFVGRRDEQALFREALQQPPEEATQFLFHIHGPGGVGKSTLARQLESAAREAGAITAYVDESVADPIEAMEAVSEQLTTQGAPSKEFDKAVAAYRQRRHEADSGLAEMGAAGSPDSGASAPAPSPSPSSMIVSQLGLAGLGMVPGVGAFAGAVSPGDLAAGADRLKAMLGARLRNHDDVRLVLSPLDTLTPAFLNGLTDAARNRPWVVLIFDTYERTGPLLDTWLRDVLVTEKYSAIPANVLVVLAGQSRLDARCWGDWLDLVTDLPLKVFSEDEARHLLAAKGITDEPVVALILKLSEGLPVLVSMLAEARPGDPAEVNDPSGTAVERFLKWETDPARRSAALACALPLDLDEDILRAAVDDADASAEELFTWLRSLPFVRAHAGRFVYHDVVRNVMLRLQRQQSPERWRSQHLRLAHAFERRRQEIESRPGLDLGRWRDEPWRTACLHETYHLLCADPRMALPGALGELVRACSQESAVLRRWVDVFTRAGEDTDADIVTEIGRLLNIALDEPAPAIAALTLLLSRAELDREDKARAYVIRGKEYRTAEQYGQAVTDYERAMALGLESNVAHLGRGEAHFATGQRERALLDFTSAIEAEPENCTALYLRALTYQCLNRFQEAIADLDRVLALDPDNALALSSRGTLHEAQARPMEALADFDRALAINPDDVPALRGRSEVHHASGRFAEALADLDKALTVTPDDPGALTLRGDLHNEAGRHAEALADYNQALFLDPKSGWALICRASTYRLVGDLEASLSDLSRFLEIHPDNADVLFCRGHVHRLSGKFEDALADLARTVELGQADGATLLERALVLHALDAADRDLAVAQATELLESEAMPHEDNAAEGATNDLHETLGNLFLVHCLAPDWEKADRRLADFLNLQPLPDDLSDLLIELTALANLCPGSAERIGAYQRQLCEALADPSEAVRPSTA
ncbi:tetratricopeptide repeat protein [Streptomyces koyangensis]